MVAVVAFCPKQPDLPKRSRKVGDEPVFRLCDTTDGKRIWVSSFMIKSFEQIEHNKWKIHLSDGITYEVIDRFYDEKYSNPLPYQFNP